MRNQNIFAPESVPADDNYANTFRIVESMLIAPTSVAVGM